jgi:hypothetical protein
MYAEGGMTTRQIGAVVGVPSRTVARYLQKAGVQLRNPGDPAIEQLMNHEWLEREYAGKSTTAIAAEIGCSARSVALWLERHGIQARNTGSQPGHERNSTDECRQKMSAAKRGQFIGSDNPNWRGGIQLKHPERNRYPAKMWVKAVKDRDGWKCTGCSAADNTYETYDAVGNREELADKIYQITPEETPFLSLIGRKPVKPRFIPSGRPTRSPRLI